MIPAISSRRSIRQYTGDPVSREDVLAILEAGNRAPSAKNRQPWRFLVLTGKAKARAAEAMRQGIARERQGKALLPGSTRHLAGAEYTARIMDQAPVVVLVANPYGTPLSRALDPEERVYELANLQSIGACIENICLEAAARGLGTLWICDLFFAYEELSRLAGMEGELAAAIAVGHPAENPSPRPQRKIETIVEWRED